MRLPNAMKLVVGIALATKRAVSSEGDEVPEERGRIGRLSGGRRGKHQSGQRPGRHRARAREGGSRVFLLGAECPRPLLLMPDFCQKANPGSGVRVAIEPGAAQLQL